MNVQAWTLNNDCAARQKLSRQASNGTSGPVLGWETMRLLPTIEVASRGGGRRGSAGK